MDLNKFEFVGRSKGSTRSFKLNEKALSINIKGRISVSTGLIDRDKIGSEGKGIGFMYNELDKVALLVIGHEGKNIMLAEGKRAFNSTTHAERIASTLDITPDEKGKYKVFVGEPQETDSFTIYQLTAEDVSEDEKESPPMNEVDEEPDLSGEGEGEEKPVVQTAPVLDDNGWENETEEKEEDLIS